MHLAGKHHTSISRAMLAGLASGIVASLLIVIFNVIYMNATGFGGTFLFAPLFIFIAIPLFSIVVGFIFYEMVEYLKPGRLFFTLLFLALMVIAIIAAMNQGVRGTRGLIIGMVLITGLLTALLLPYFATHAKLFMDKDDFEESEEI